MYKIKTIKMKKNLRIIIVLAVLAITAILSAASIKEESHGKINTIIEEELVVESWMTQPFIAFEEELTVEDWMTELFV